MSSYQKLDSEETRDGAMYSQTTTLQNGHGTGDESTEKGQWVKFVEFAMDHKKTLLFFLLVIFSVVLLFSILLSTGVLWDLLDWIDELSYFPKTLLLLFFIVLTCLPPSYGYSIFILAAGFIYGFWIGLVTVVFCVIIGALVSFFSSRYFFKEAVLGAFKQNELTTLLLFLFHQNQIKTVFILHFTPLTFGLTVGFLAVTDIAWYIFLPVNTLAALPYQILAVSIGSSVSELSDVDNQNIEQTVILGVQIAISLGLVVFLIVYSRRYFRTLQQQHQHYQIELISESNNQNNTPHHPHPHPHPESENHKKPNQEPFQNGYQNETLEL